MKANKLIESKSLYLQQHAHNPVQWFPWSTEALDKSRKENKPILVSIGYSACHWCHVMEKESFEDEEVAELMNTYFVCIKIDREERPDLDNIYMEAVQVMGLQGGWPLNVFLMPDHKPFYGGTYFPKEQWIKVLSGVAHAFSHQYEDLAQSAAGFGRSIDRSVVEKYGLKKAASNFTSEMIRDVAGNIAAGIDPDWGGMKRVPKFPMPAIWNFLLDMAILDKQASLGDQVSFTLQKIGMGGIYDHLGGGFCRYSVDGEWFAPHFEKMLYDNGQLLGLYAKAYQYNKDSFFKEKVVETTEWLSREMQSPEKGFYAAVDADSEGKEGKFYTWTYSELGELLGDDLDWFSQLYSVKDGGNWESGLNILFQKETYEKIAGDHGFSMDVFHSKLKEVKQKLLAKRDQRIRPGLDDKIISGWNGWVIDGFCHAFLAIGDEAYKTTALEAGEFIWKEMVRNSVLFRNFKEKEAYTPAFLEDYAAVIQSFISLYKITFDGIWLHRADKLTQRVMANFLDQSDGLFYFNDPKSEKLIADKKEIFDNVIPASNSVMARNLHQLGLYFYSDIYLKQAESMLQLIGEMLVKDPGFLANWANLYLEKAVPTAEIAVAGPDAVEQARFFQAVYQPNMVIAAASEATDDLPLLADKSAKKTTFFVCFNQSCKQPVERMEEARKQLPFLANIER